MRLTAAFRAFGAALACVALVAWAPGASAARAEPSARDWKTIRQVIGDQRAALRKDDTARAFGFASRGLRAQFESAENFMRSAKAPVMSAGVMIAKLIWNIM